VRRLIDRRRSTGTSLMKSGRMAVRQGRAFSGASRTLIGALLAPEVAAAATLAPAIRRSLSRIRRHPLARRWIVPDATKSWLQTHALHVDGWAGPTLIVELNIDSSHTHLILEGAVAPGPERRALTLRAIHRRTPLGQATRGPNSDLPHRVGPAGVYEGHAHRIASARTRSRYPPSRSTPMITGPCPIA